MQVNKTKKIAEEMKIKYRYNDWEYIMSQDAIDIKYIALNDIISDYRKNLYCLQSTFGFLNEEVVLQQRKIFIEEIGQFYVNAYAKKVGGITVEKYKQFIDKFQQLQEMSEKSLVFFKNKLCFVPKQVYGVVHLGFNLGSYLATLFLKQEEKLSRDTNLDLI